MEDQDHDVPGLDEEREREVERVATLRAFRVDLHDGTVEHVFAHSWSNESPAGHLNFFTVSVTGRMLIHDSYAVGTWFRVHEVTARGRARLIDQIAKSEQATQAMGRRATSRKVH